MSRIFKNYIFWIIIYNICLSIIHIILDIIDNKPTLLADITILLFVLMSLLYCIRTTQLEIEIEELNKVNKRNNYE